VSTSDEIAERLEARFDELEAKLDGLEGVFVARR
jgi:hypothetical protein